MQVVKRKKKRVLLVGIAYFWIVLILGIVASDYVIREASKKQVLEKIEFLTEEASQSVENEIDTQLKELSVTADYLTDEEVANPEETVQGFGEMIEKNGYDGMGIISLDGIAHMYSGQTVDVCDAVFFLQALEGESSVTNTVRAKAREGRINVYVAPIVKHGKVKAAICATVISEDFYDTMELNYLENTGQPIMIDGEGNMLAGDSEKDGDFYAGIRDGSVHNRSSLKKMAEDISEGKDGNQKFTVHGREYFLYYTKLKYNDWWILTRISEESIDAQNEDIERSVKMTETFLICLAGLALLDVVRRERNINRYLRKRDFTDSITGGKSNLYLKDYMKKLHPSEKHRAIVSFEISNIKLLIKVVGINNVYDALKEFYWEVENSMNEGEQIVHSYTGEFKLLYEYTTNSELRGKLEALCFIGEKYNFVYRCGVYEIEDIDMQFEALIANAYMAKENIPEGKKYAIYEEEMHQKEIAKEQLKQEIMHGVENDEFQAWYQPKYAKDGKTVVGAEALVRWYKDGKPVSPAVFIPICEAYGWIRDVDHNVVVDTCRHLKQWIDEGKAVPISVNLSRKYIDSHTLVGNLVSIAAAHGVPHDMIEFEVTESSLVKNEEKFKSTIDDFHERGFKVLLDDFGVGYSSIKAIGGISFDILKIDKSFVDGIGNRKWEAIIRYTIDMAKKLHMEVVAEGIEEKKQYDFLVENGCEIFQGYYFGKPMCADDFSKLLDENRKMS